MSIHRALWAIFLSGTASLAVAQDHAECKTKTIPDAKLREIAIAEREKRARAVSTANWEFEISREGCAYRVFAQETPARVARHYSVLIDESGRVLRYFGGM